MVAVTAALDGLEVVALRGADIAQARAAAFHIDDDGRDMAARHVGDAFLHQRDAAAGRRGHGRDAAGAGAQQHVDGGHFAFGLHELAAAFGQPEGHGLGDLVLRRDGIAEIAAAAGVQGAKGHSFIALDENAVVTHAVFSVFWDLKTRMATSGHMSAQEAQPVQRPSVSITS